MTLKSFFNTSIAAASLIAALYLPASAQTKPSPNATTSTQQDTTPSGGGDTRTRRTGNANRGSNQSQNAADEAAKKSVLAAFDALLEGIRRTNVRAVMNAYWNSPQLVLFNNNGTVTKTSTLR